MKNMYFIKIKELSTFMNIYSLILKKMSSLWHQSHSSCFILFNLFSLFLGSGAKGFSQA